MFEDHRYWKEKLSISVKDAFEMFFKIFHGNGAQLVKDSSDFRSIIGVGISTNFLASKGPV